MVGFERQKKNLHLALNVDSSLRLSASQHATPNWATPAQLIFCYLIIIFSCQNICHPWHTSLTAKWIHTKKKNVQTSSAHPQAFLHCPFLLTWTTISTCWFCSRLSTWLFSDQNTKYEVYTLILCSCYWIVSLGCHWITWYLVEKRKQNSFLCPDWVSNPQPPDCHVLIKQHLEVWGRWQTQKNTEKENNNKEWVSPEAAQRMLKRHLFRYIYISRPTG